MSDALVLFKKLDLAYVQQELIGQEFENNWLECKEKQKSDQGALDQGDKSNFAKALAGFANTSGGILIFGLEARKKDEIDQILGIKPIKELKRFESTLREHESRIVERLVAGVEYLRIETAPDEGMVAVYVPESQHLPHRSQIDSKFYIRAGGTFSAIGVSLIEDLFARRKKPALKLLIKTDGGITVYLANTGQVSARHPYVVIRLPNSVAATGYEIDGNSYLRSWVRMSSYKNAEGNYWAFRDGGTTVIHPHSELPLLHLKFGPGQAPKGTLEFEHHLYAEDMAPVEDTFVLQVTQP